MAESVLYERRGVATLLTINRPEARNAVNGCGVDHEQVIQLHIA